jgi:hypothetical protein
LRFTGEWFRTVKLVSASLDRVSVGRSDSDSALLPMFDLKLQS